MVVTTTCEWCNTSPSCRFCKGTGKLEIPDEDYAYELEDDPRQMESRFVG